MQNNGYFVYNDQSIMYNAVVYPYGDGTYGATDYSSFIYIQIDGLKLFGFMAGRFYFRSILDPT